MYEIGRVAVILYLVALLLTKVVPMGIIPLILIVGAITIIYTLLGGMEAVIWTDVMQSAIMLVGVIFCAGALTIYTFSQPDYLIQTAFDQKKFGLGNWHLDLTERTIWVMVIYGIVENLRNLIADQKLRSEIRIRGN